MPPLTLTLTFCAAHRGDFVSLETCVREGLCNLPSVDDDEFLLSLTELKSAPEGRPQSRLRYC